MATMEQAFEKAAKGALTEPAKCGKDAYIAYTGLGDEWVAWVLAEHGDHEHPMASGLGMGLEAARHDARAAARDIAKMEAERETPPCGMVDGIERRAA